MSSIYPTSLYGQFIALQSSILNVNLNSVSQKHINNTQNRINEILKEKPIPAVADALQEISLQLKYLAGEITLQRSEGIKKTIEAIEAACQEVFKANTKQFKTKPNAETKFKFLALFCQSLDAAAQFVYSNKLDLNFSMDGTSITFLQSVVACTNPVDADKHLAHVKFLLIHGADPNYFLPHDVSFAAKEQPLSPLLLACENYFNSLKNPELSRVHREIVQALLAHGAKVDLCDDQKKLFLNRIKHDVQPAICRVSPFEITMNLLIQLTGDENIINSEDGFGNNLMFYACEIRNLTSIHYIHSKGGMISLKAIEVMGKSDHPIEWIRITHQKYAKWLKKLRGQQIQALDSELGKFKGLRINPVDVLQIIRSYIL